MKKNLKKNYFLDRFYLFKFWLKVKFLSYKKSYSQLGEDLIIDKFFKNFTGTYVDIGCFNPIKYNNTMLLYLRGWSGTNIDLNPMSINLFNMTRKRDKNIIACLSNKRKISQIYFDDNFSPLNSIYNNNKKNFALKNIKKIKVRTKVFSDLVKDKFDFLNIDCEDSDFDILKTINLNHYKPKLICIEIRPNNKFNIYKYLRLSGYRLFKIKKVSHFFIRNKY